MPKKHSLGRSRPRPPPPSPPPLPPHLMRNAHPPLRPKVTRTPTSKYLTQTERPPPADAIFRENTPEQKVFEIPALRRVSKLTSRPLTGRPPAPKWSRGVKQPKGSASEKKSGSGRQTVNPSDSVQNPLEIIQTSLLQIQSYLDTLAAVRTQQNQPSPHTQTHQTHPTPRAIPVPSSSPATLADLISMPQHSRKR